MRTSLSQTVPHSEDNLGDEDKFITNSTHSEDTLGDQEDNLGDEEDKFITNSTTDQKTI